MTGYHAAVRVGAALFIVLVLAAPMDAHQARPDFIKALIGNRPFTEAPGGPPRPVDPLMAGLNGNILEVYGDWTLVEIHVADQQTLRDRGRANDVSVTLRENFDRISINGHEFDARDPIGTLPTGHTADPPYPPGRKGMWLIQFMGPIKSEWLEAVKAAGMAPVQNISDHAYIASATEEELRVVAGLRFIQWTMQMHHFLKPAQRWYRGFVRARVFLAETSDTDDTVALLAGLSRGPVTTGLFSPTELNLFGVFRTDHIDYILSQPLVWGWSEIEADEAADIPVLTDAALIAAAALLAAAGCLRMRA